MAESKKVSLLLTLELTASFETEHWPAHMTIDSTIAGVIWGGLNAALEMGCATPGEASHIVALTFNDKAYPDWLPKVTLAEPGCSRVITPLLRHALKEDTDEGMQLSPLGDEPPQPQLEANSVRVNLRGVPKGEPVIRECDIPGKGRGFEGAIMVTCADIVFNVSQPSGNREHLQRDLDTLIAAGDIQVIGTMRHGGIGGDGKILPLVFAEHWAPIPAHESLEVAESARENPTSSPSAIS